MSKKCELKEIKDASGTLLIIELKFQTRFIKGWFRDNVSPMVDMIKCLVPGTDRQYDPATFTWTISATYWAPVRTILEGSSWDFVNKYDQTANVRVDAKYAESFYNAPSGASASPSENLEEILSELITESFPKLSLDAQKAAYRIACRKYHPDLGGDAAKMSELNRVWTLYTKSLTTAGGV